MEEENKQPEEKKEIQESNPPEDLKTPSDKPEPVISETPAPESEGEPEEEDELTGIEEATEQEIVQKVTKKETRKKRKRRGEKSSSQEKGKDAPEWIEKVVQIRRVTKVVKGGKKLSFRAVVIVGNAKGQVGVGVGKASEVISAIQKSVVDAKKQMVNISLIDTTIPHEIIGRSGAAMVLLKPAREGTGIIAGGVARTVLELGGVGDILSKSLRSRSPLNVARATLDGLKRLRKFQDVANLRGVTLKEMISN